MPVCFLLWGEFDNQGLSYEGFTVFIACVCNSIIGNTVEIQAQIVTWSTLEQQVGNKGGNWQISEQEVWRVWADPAEEMVSFLFFFFCIKRKSRRKI